jgi:hypothetical protein
MEGTIMVAMNPFIPLCSPPQTSIKILNLLTNRYFVGIVRASLDDGLYVELPASARLTPGQRIHFALDNSPGVISRITMRSATIRDVKSFDGRRLHVNLATAECLAA